MQMHWWWLSLLYLLFVENETWSESGDGCEELPHTCADSAEEPSRERAVLQGETLDKRLNIDGVKSAFTDLLSLVILVFLCSIFFSLSYKHVLTQVWLNLFFWKHWYLRKSLTLSMGLYMTWLWRSCCGSFWPDWTSCFQSQIWLRLVFVQQIGCRILKYELFYCSLKSLFQLHCPPKLLE